MEGQHRRNRSHTSGAKSDRHSIHDFIPYPLELADLERREGLPPTQLRVLMLRRFADPKTGVWESSTKEIARMLRCGRSSVQKVLRKSERERYLHIRDLRGRTVRRQLCFGGFPQPFHKKLGLPPLRWDSDFTPADTEPERTPKSSTPVENSAKRRESGFTEPKTDPQGTAERTERGTNITNNELTNNELTNDELTNHNEQRDSFTERTSEHRTNELYEHDEQSDEKHEQAAVEKLVGSGALTPVQVFQPRNEDESTVQALASSLGERFINSFLSLSGRYGLPRLQRACGLAHAKLRDRKHPLRQRPGAYVRWLLQNGKC